MDRNLIKSFFQEFYDETIVKTGKKILYSDLRYFVLIKKILEKMDVGFVALKENKLELDKQIFIENLDIIEVPLAYNIKKLDKEKKNEFLKLVGRFVCKFFIKMESDKNLGDHEKYNFGKYFIQLIETSDFYEQENVFENLIDMEYIKKQTEYYKGNYEETLLIKKSNLQQKNVTKNNFQSFSDIFKDPSDAKKIIVILKAHSYIDQKGKWNGSSGNKTEPVSLVEILIEKEYTRNKKRATLVKAFMTTYGVHISPRSINAGGTPDDLATFEKLIPSREKL